ncbi:cyclic di-GMP phosphodiesterase [Lachnospiraceae bacterium]|nr:cyclic di-GMP phosphodiesterase [Lachnospiraceae bacterium]
MKLCRVENLKGGEILSKDVMTSDVRVLLSEGTELRPEYIDKINRLGITEVYIKEEEKILTQEVVILKSETEGFFKDRVKSILEKHTYSKNDELMELSQTADHIITNILEEEEVVEKIYDIKERSCDIYEHSISICSLATLTALKLKLSKEKVHDIGVACLLHDLGLRYLTIEYADQDISTLSKIELAEYMKHPVYGYSALKDENWISNAVKNIILYHHERLDGTGYPLKAKEIPFETQIVNICDTFDEMICGIGCKRIKVYEAVEYLKSYRGIKFNSDIVDTFLEFTAVYPAGSQVLLSDNRVGKVVRQNKEFPDRPVIQIIKDKSGKLVNEEIYVDLIKVNNIFIEKVLE